MVVYDLMLVDRYLAPHARHYLRQMRVLGYKQFLASYRRWSSPLSRPPFPLDCSIPLYLLAGLTSYTVLCCSVTLESMARIFGVSTEFLDMYYHAYLPWSHHTC